MEFYIRAYKYLRLLNIKISKSYLRERLESHIEYPSLKSLTDILDDFGIQNRVIQVKEKKRWKELEFPFLSFIHSERQGGDFKIVKNKRSVTSEKTFLLDWTGITLLVEKNAKIKHEEHRKQYQEERNKSVILQVILFLILLMFTSIQLTNFTLSIFLHFTFSLAGLIVSIMIIAYTLGLNSNVSDLFCKVQESGCNTVLNSKLGRFGSYIGLGDIAAIFFACELVYLTFSMSLQLSSNLLFLFTIHLIVFAFSFVSIGYQWFLKSWCKLCLMTTLIIWLQTINLGISLFYETLSWQSLLHLPFKMYLLFGTCLVLTSIWIILKPFMLIKLQKVHDKIRLRKWRQNPLWFDALLPLHKKIDDEVWDREIFYGNALGILQILIVSDPFCEYCSQAHQELDKILDKNPEDIGIRVRFTLKDLNPDSKKYSATYKILNIYEEHVWNKNLGPNNLLMKSIITDWFENIDSNFWSDKYESKVDNYENVTALIKKSFNWSHSMNISQTPAFFINGYEMPNPHTFKDLFLFVSDYIEILKQRKSPNSEIYGSVT